MVDASPAIVNEDLQINLYGGNVIVPGRQSATDSLFDQSVATFEDNLAYVID